MPSTFDTSRVHRLARKLEEDIRRRGLTVGDRYLTATEAAEEYDVSISTAHRALKLLADSQMLLRRRNHGTFVGMHAGNSKTCVIETIQFVTPEDTDARTEEFSSWCNGLRRVFPRASVQFNVIPSDNPVDYVAELIRGAKSAGRLLGVVANSCPDIYDYLGKTGVPAVVSGSLRHGDPPLASIDFDNRESGRILVRHLAEKGHRRIALFGHNDNRPGTHDLLDGIVEGITEAGLPANSLVVRFLPGNLDEFGEAVVEILADENRPTAAITFGMTRVRAIAQAAKELGLAVPGDLEIAFHGDPESSDEAMRYARAVSRMTVEDQAVAAGEMLKRLMQGRAPESSRIVMPVELREAGSE